MTNTERTMTVAELRRCCVAVFGEQGWQTACAKKLGVDARTIRRYVAGDLVVPGPVAVALRCLAGKVQ